MGTIVGYPQDYISIDPDAFCVGLRSFSRTVAIGLICLFASRTWAAEGNKALALRRNVLRVLSAGTGENGFGFIVSDRDDKLYIVIADHVVASTPDIPAPSVRVVFFADQGKSYRAEILKHKTDHDLALLEVERPPGFKWEKQCLATAHEATRGTAVWFIGRDEEWYVPAANGLISSPNPSADWWLDADMPNLRPGSSGVPLVTNSGIIGMVKAKSVDDTRVLSIEYIKTAVQDWGYPWNLITVGAGEIAGSPKPQGTPTVTQPKPTRGSESDKGIEPQTPPGFSAEVANSYRKSLAGDSDEMLIVGNAYRYGRGARQDNRQAAYWYSKAAKAGDPAGMIDLGFMYENGFGVEKDYGQAINWYRNAAKAGNAAAMRGLGLMYQAGHGVPSDFAQAARWYRKAAQGGDAGGMVNLGIMYEYGWGVQQDKQQAIYWYGKAAQLGSAWGMQNLGRLSEKP